MCSRKLKLYAFSVDSSRLCPTITCSPKLDVLSRTLSTSTSWFGRSLCNKQSCVQSFSCQLSGTLLWVVNLALQVGPSKIRRECRSCCRVKSIHGAAHVRKKNSGDLQVMAGEPSSHARGLLCLRRNGSCHRSYEKYSCLASMVQ